MGRNGRKGANQHNAKHENGIVAPGKRVTKQKSNTQLANDSAETSKNDVSSTTSVPPLPQSTAHVQDVSDFATGSKTRFASVPRTTSNQSQADSGSEDVEELESMSWRATEQQHHRTIDVSTAKKTPAHASGNFQSVMTVLKAHPIIDTLTILMVLISLPSAWLHITNLFFSVLTFQPPAGSFTTLPSLSDMTSSFSPGAPSILVMILIDLIAICLWTILPWPSLQGFLLNSASVTVATTLGGGYQFASGSSDNFFLMMIFMVGIHMGQYRRTILKGLHRTSLARYLPLVESVEDLPANRSFVLSGDRSWFDTFKIYLAIHILFQGLTRVIRRALNAPRGDTFTSGMTDPEANKDYSTADSIEMHAPGSPTTARTKMSLQNLRDSKRRKRQANHAKSQQPLWATIAAIIQSWLRNREHAQATKEALQAHSSGTQDLGNAHFETIENKIFTTAVEPDRLYFETGPIRCPESHNVNKTGNEVECESISPIFIRINGADWVSVNILAVEDSRDAEGRERWTGQIYGLSAGSTFKVSFFRREDEVELYSTSISTPPLQIAEQIRSTNTVPAQALRPASPASPIDTVKAAIGSTEGDINELSANQKRIRKENKLHKAKMDKEIDSLTERSSRVSTAFRNMTQKQTHFENSIKQIQDGIVSTTAQVNEQGSIPAEDTAEWQEHKEAFEATRNELSRVQEDVQRTKESNRAELTAAQTKELAERQKRDRAQTRVKKLAADHDNLNAPARQSDQNPSNSRGASRSAELDFKEVQARNQLEALRAANVDMVRDTLQIKQEIDQTEHIVLQNALHATKARLAHGSRPITPEGDLPGTHPHASGINQSANFARPHGFQTPELSSAIPATAGKIFTNGFSSGRHNSVSTRNRSQSALSGNSGYAAAADEEDDEEDEDPIPALHKRRTGLVGVMDGSDGRSSGSGSPHVSAGPIAPPPIGSERRTSPAQTGIPS